MNSSVKAVMSGVSLVVVGLSLRASWGPANVHAVAGAQQAGIVTAGGSPTASPKARAAAKPRPSARPRPAATRLVTTVVVPRAAPSAAPRPAPKPRPTVAPSTTVNGTAMDTQYGPVQVQIVVQSGRITQANAIEYPQGSPNDQQINSYAIPQLNSETLQAQSSNIDSVSGATYTSDGYIASLQSAIDAAHQAGLM